MERIDVRKLTVEGRNMLRQMVLRLRQQSGMRVEDLAKVSGCIFWTIVGTDSDASWAVILIDRGH
jgi:hypothetical protein